MKNNKIYLFLALTILFSFINFNNAFQEDDEIIVLYLEAPLFYSKFGTLLKNINAFHSGLGFYTLNSNESYTIDFVADPGVLQSLLPQRVENGEVFWNSSGKVQIKNTIDDTGYWSSELEIFKIDSKTFDTFVCWAKEYNNSHSFYQLFDVFNRPLDMFDIRSTVCNDFAWASFHTLYNLGGRYVSQGITAKRDIVTIYTEEPIFIVEDGSTNPQVVEFYQSMLNISLNTNQTIDGLIDELSVIFQGTFYLYVDGQYMNITLDSSPLNFTYSETPLPSGDRDISSVGDCVPTYENNSIDDGIGGGWIFIIILVSFTTCYLVGGVLINKFKNDKYGTDLIPNKDSWSDLGGLISDGFGFIKGKITGTTTSGGNGYSSLG